MVNIDLRGKHALVMGVANHRSLSWAIAHCLHEAVARVCVTYANERIKPTVEELTGTLAHSFTAECDVTKDYAIDEVRRKIQGRWGSLEILVHGSWPEPRGRRHGTPGPGSPSWRRPTVR